MGLVLLIPAYRPGEALPARVEAVRGEFDGCVFGDDGSGAGRKTGLFLMHFRIQRDLIFRDGRRG